MRRNSAAFRESFSPGKSFEAKPNGSGAAAAGSPLRTVGFPSVVWGIILYLRVFPHPTQRPEPLPSRK